MQYLHVSPSCPSISIVSLAGFFMHPPSYVRYRIGPPAILFPCMIPYDAIHTSGAGVVRNFQELSDQVAAPAAAPQERARRAAGDPGDGKSVQSFVQS